MTHATGWSRRHLERVGFEGWVPWSACPVALESIPTAAGGVYVVFSTAVAAPIFLDRSTAGTFREETTVPRSTLEANWVPEAVVLYIGSADAGRLRKRLREYVRFGRGHRAKHFGGRLVWQLDGADKLLVAWRELSADEDPEAEKRRMLADFRSAYGKPPFANDPQLLGR
jgi:hypothetical protein